MAAGAVLVVLAVVAGAGSRTSTLRRLVVETLAERLDSDVELQAFSVDTFPVVNVRGAGLVVRLRGTGDVPPLVTIRSFVLEGGLLGLLERPRRFASVTIEGLEINIPPGGAALPPGDGSAVEDDSSGQPASPIHVERLHAREALLRLIPKKAGKEPREFTIHRLEMDDVGVAHRMPFRAELTNPIPVGEIRTEGRFGARRCMRAVR